MRISHYHENIRKGGDWANYRNSKYVQEIITKYEDF